MTTASLEAFLPTYSAQVVARALVEPSNPPTVEPQTIAIEIEYCVRCAYREPAVRLVDALLEKLGQNMKSVALLPSDGGRFEVLLNGELVFSGLRRGRPPTLEEVTALLGL